MNGSHSYHIYFQLILLGLISSLLLTSPVPKQATIAQYEALLAYENGIPLLASNRLAKAAEFFPWRSDLWCLAGQWALQAEDPQASISFISQVYDNATLSADCLMTLGNAYLASEDFSQAIQTWKKIPDSAGYLEAVLRNLLETYQATAEYPQAIEVLKSLNAINPTQPEYAYQLGLLLAIFDPHTSLDYLSQASKIDSPRTPQIYSLIQLLNQTLVSDEPAYTAVSVGRWLAIEGDWRLASLAFNEAIQLRPDYAEAWAYLGEALQHSDPASEKLTNQVGLQEIQKALEIDPKSVLANTLMSVYWQRRMADKKALEYLDKAILVDPDNPILLVEYGELIAAQGDLATAQTYYERAVTTAPDDPLFWRLLAEFSINHQVQVRQIALPAAQRVMQLAPQDPQSLDLMGKTLIYLGDLDNAEKILLEAIRLDESFVYAHLHLGIVYLNKDDVIQAQREFELAEALAPNSAISEEINRLYSYYFP